MFKEFYKNIVGIVSSYSVMLKIMLFIMGLLIVTFNVKGYEVLFGDTPLIPFIPVSPFGVLLGFAELSVLVWTSAVISNWHGSSRILKFSIWLLVPAFSFLSYAGINSYLGTLASKDIQEVNEIVLISKNNAGVLLDLQKEKALKIKEIDRVSEEQVNLNNQISAKNNHINDLLKEASIRRLTASDCSAVRDCADTVQNLDNQTFLLKSDVASLNRTRERNDGKIAKAENRVEVVTSQISALKLNERDAKNEVANTESSYTLKKANYERIIISVAGVFNIKPEDPFGVLVSLLSFLIYPVYFILNLYTGLNSQSNIDVREKRAKQKKERKSLRNALLKSISVYIRALVLRKKVSIRQNLKDAIVQRRTRKSRREKYYIKMMRYFRVWAHRRKKTRDIEVERIVEKELIIEKEIEIVVEKEVEVEKIIEKIQEIKVEVRVEVPVYVDKIVEVPTEIPIFIDKIKKVPEPFFIKEPEIIIHERLVPVPADITAQELEMIFNAQPRLNAIARDAENTVLIRSEEEGLSETENPTEESEPREKGKSGEAA